MDQFPLPPWLSEMPNGDEKEAHLNRFSIKLAALYASPRGTVSMLADLIGMNYRTLKSQTQTELRLSMTWPIRKGILKIVGKQFLPEALRDWHQN